MNGTMSAKGGELKFSIGDPKENRLAQRRRDTEDINVMMNDILRTELFSGVGSMKVELGYFSDCKEAFLKQTFSLA